MKKRIIPFLLFIFLCLPTVVNAKANYANTNITNLINTNAIVQEGAIVNDAFNANNLNVIMIGMVIVILVLVGATMFAQKK